MISLIDSKDTPRSYAIATCIRTFLSMNELLLLTASIPVYHTSEYLYSLSKKKMAVQMYGPDLSHFVPNQSSIVLDMILDVRIATIVH